MKIKAAAMSVATLVLAACSENGSPREAPRIDPESFTVSSLSGREWPDLQGEASPGGMSENLTTRNLMVVLDMSGSMDSSSCAGNYPTKAAAAKSVLSRWIGHVPDSDNVGLVVFDSEGTQVRVPLGPKDADAFMQAVNASEPYGGTPLRSALELAYGEIEAQAVRQRSYGEYRIVTVTDGAHSNGENPASVVERIAGNPVNPVELYTIGFCISGSALHQPGRTFYQSASDPEALEDGMTKVLAETDSAVAQQGYFDTEQEQTR